MLIRQNLRLLLIFISIATTVAILLAGCSPSQLTQSAQPTATVPSAQATPTDIWKALQERTPFPYTTPLPPAVATPIDGTYVKEEPIIGERVHCRRCPEWAHGGGLWKLRFHKGIYIALHVDTGWRSLGSYIVSGDRVFLFNDPVCQEDVGVYTWKVEKGQLAFQEISDPCFIHLRAQNLMWQLWLSCQPPNIEAAVTDHWEKPKGCE